MVEKSTVHPVYCTAFYVYSKLLNMYSILFLVYIQQFEMCTLELFSPHTHTHTQYDDQHTHIKACVHIYDRVTHTHTHKNVKRDRNFMHFRPWEHTLHLQWNWHAFIHVTCTLLFLLIIKTHSSWVQNCMLLTYEWCMFSDCSGFSIGVISSATSANLWNQFCFILLK